MTVWVLLLRGVNVGGAGKLPMAQLRAAIGAAGGEAVATYIQSGNAVFRAPGPRAALSDRIGREIRAAAGIVPDRFLLTADELGEALEANPFPDARDDAKPMHLFFHDGSARPDAAALDAVLAPDEAWQLTDRVLYLRAPSGIGRSKFVQQLPRLFKARTTARNLTTCRKLAEMAAAL